MNCLVLIAGVVLLQGEQLPDIRHEMGGDRPARLGPATLQSIQRQLDDVDLLVGDRTAERLAVWDTAIAGSQAEHDDIGQGVLVLVVAVARSESDLPLRRVYVTGPKGKPLGLVPVGTVPREMLQALRISGKGGSHVWGGVYFLGAARRMAHGPLYADFATRSDFQLGSLSNAWFGDLEDKPGTIHIYLGNVALMANREYPGLKLLPDFAKALGSADQANGKEESRGPWN